MNGVALHERGVVRLSHGETDALVTCGSIDGMLQVVDGESLEVVKSIKLRDGILCCAQSPAAPLIVIGDDHNFVKVECPL